MGVVGSLPLSNVNNDDHTESAHQQISHAHLCMKELQMVAKKLVNRRCLKHRRCDHERIVKREFRCEKYRHLTPRLKFKSENIHEQLRRKVQELELQQNHLLSTVTKLHLYKQELQLVCQHINFKHELLE